MIKKPILWTLAFFLGSSLLLSQDLVEAAKKEKERRAQLKKRSTFVVMNVHLGKKSVEEIAAIRGAEEPSRKIQVTSSQTSPTLQRKSPVLKVTNQDQMEARGYPGDFATRIASANEFVRNSNLALNKPDGRFAELSMLGILDLEINAINGPGDDIAIYAMQTGAKETLPDGEEHGGIPVVALSFGYTEGFWYGVLGKTERGNWVAIGQGKGWNSPEKFDLGSLESVSNIRIIFKPHDNADLGVYYDRGTRIESTFRIDAVESLNK